jgi:hypothetical protein
MTDRNTVKQNVPTARSVLPAVMNELRWLTRYANHCGFHVAGHAPMLQALRAAFGVAAWRIVCRCPKACFMPILRNRELSIQSLITYCKRLAERSFVQAPQPILLAYFVRQRRLYFDRPCRIPQENDYDLIRVANRCDALNLRDIACVSNWACESRTSILPTHKWSTLVIRARKYNEREQVHLASTRHYPWHFFCRTTDWRGHQVEPITDTAGLWSEGQRHGSCLYRLRYECTAAAPSRFFRISRQGRSVATLELAWRAPEEEFEGMDRVWGKWEMRDLRLSFNRLPDEQLVHSMQAFAGMYNIWAKRIRRMPPGYLQETSAHIRRAKRLSVWDVFTSEESTPA